MDFLLSSSSAIELSFDSSLSLLSTVLTSNELDKEFSGFSSVSIDIYFLSESVIELFLLLTLFIIFNNNSSSLSENKLFDFDIFESF